MNTKFQTIYDCFYSKITDDMYMELDQAQTDAMTEELLIGALPNFEFPRFNIYAFDKTAKEYQFSLSYEEINIIAVYMVVGWLTQQLASVENTRMKFSGSDFKFTSQANHMARLLTLKKDFEREGFHLQRLYKRRIADKNGIMRSTMGTIMGNPVTDAPATDRPGDNNGTYWQDYESEV